MLLGDQEAAEGRKRTFKIQKKNLQLTPASQLICPSRRKEREEDRMGGERGKDGGIVTAAPDI